MVTPASAHPKFTIELDGNRVGNDYRHFETNSLENCVRTCATEGRCMSFTFVPRDSQPPNFNNLEGICWLKDRVPSLSSVDGMVSGVKHH